jgi:hypothetical protein
MAKPEDSVVLPGIAPGMLLQIQFEGLGSSRSRLIGIDDGSFLIIQTPAITEIWSKRYEKNHCIVRYLFAGKVFAFRCTLLAVIKDPCRLSILSYPESVENINLRKHERTSCIIAAEVNIGGRTYEGIVSDISIGGCSFEFNLSARQEFPTLNIKDNLQILLHLREMPTTCAFAATVRSIKTDKENLMTGIQFVESDSAATDADSLAELTKFISSLGKDAV